MIKAGLVGLGKMGIYHQAIITAHPDVQLVAVCDAAGYMLDLMSKYIGVRTYSDYRKMIDMEELDCVVIATPSKFHGDMVRYALEHNLHVFCEKPFCLNVDEGVALVEMAAERKLVNQVGYHCRFIGAFREARRLVQSQVLGRIHHMRAEVYGPVVLRPKGSTWRHSKGEGGGCLYDYASHAIDLVHYLTGESPQAVGGTVLNKIFSHNVEDEVYSTLYFSDGTTGQLAANWSDDTYRKMSTRITLWGTKGRLNADRQECQIYLSAASDNEDVASGWTVKNTVELTDPVWFYLRGEEYSAQIDHFVQCIKAGNVETECTFASALQTDRVVQMLLTDTELYSADRDKGGVASRPKRRPSLLSGLFGKH